MEEMNNNIYISEKEGKEKTTWKMWQYMGRGF